MSYTSMLDLATPTLPQPRDGESALPWAHLKVAAIVPCHNERGAIEKVVKDLHTYVPGIEVFVYDNCSTDGTAEAARQAGATVRHEYTKGKGNVVRRAFADVDADVYLLIDGDDTYDVASAPLMIRTLIDGPYDHVLGVRRPLEENSTAYRPGHEAGNRMLNRIVGTVFGTDMGDMLSGYRVFSKRFVKSFPAVSREFEIETELTVHSMGLRAPTVSVPVGFRDRAEGTESKLRTFRDGLKILALILSLARHERPLAFFGIVSSVLMLAAFALGVPVTTEYLHSQTVPQLPSLFVGVALVGIACLMMASGLVLDGIRRNRHEHSRLAYLRFSALHR